MMPPAPGIDPTDVVGKRIGAAIIDFLPALVLSYLVQFALLAGSPTSSSSAGFTFFAFGGSVLPTLVQYTWLIGNCVIWRGLTGKSLGHVALGLRTVDAQGRPLGVPTAFVRSLAGIVDYLPCFCFVPVVGLITMSRNKGHQRVGDIAAKSYVIDARYEGMPVVIPGLTSSPTGPWAIPDPGYGAAWGGGVPPAPDPTQPQWDPARNTWIRWNPTIARWEGQEPSSGVWYPL